MPLLQELKSARQDLSKDTQPQLRQRPAAILLISLAAALLSGAGAEAAWLHTAWQPPNPFLPSPNPFHSLESVAFLLLALFLTSLTLHSAAAAAGAAQVLYNKKRAAPPHPSPRTESRAGVA